MLRCDGAGKFVLARSGSLYEMPINENDDLSTTERKEKRMENGQHLPIVCACAERSWGTAETIFPSNQSSFFDCVISTERRKEQPLV